MYNIIMSSIVDASLMVTQVCAKNYIPQAYNMLGDMYRFGQGVSEDMEKAVKHYKLGAEQGML